MNNFSGALEQISDKIEVHSPGLPSILSLKEKCIPVSYLFFFPPLL